MRGRHLCAQPVGREIESGRPVHGKAVAREGLGGRQLEEPLHHRAEERDVGDGAFAFESGRHGGSDACAWLSTISSWQGEAKRVDKNVERQ